MAEGSKTSIYISGALRRCRQRSSSEDVRLDSEQIMTLLEWKPLLNSSWSTFYVNGHTRWSGFMDFYVIIWHFLCILEVLKRDPFLGTVSCNSIMCVCCHLLTPIKWLHKKKNNKLITTVSDTSIYNEDKWDRVWWTKTSLFKNWKALIWSKSVFQKGIHPHPAAGYALTLVTNIRIDTFSGTPGAIIVSLMLLL